MTSPNSPTASASERENSRDDFDEAEDESTSGPEDEHNTESVMIISLVPLLCAACFLNLEPLLLLTGTEPDIAKDAAEYVLWFFPGLFFLYNSYILSRYLQAQDKAFVPLAATLLANAVNIGLNYLLVIQWRLGIK
ncbi:unnamed protein product [Dibothriocephalus latus]|uniref:Uncharacterized protein n=1 Tax=Dibothriocephalus latus TaxID=60516 RepID=A0A3P7LEI8_DIBLA|nr:unnamed protein product [Dibothriocephalus latus]